MARRRPTPPGPFFDEGVFDECVFSDGEEPGAYPKGATMPDTSAPLNEITGAADILVTMLNGLKADMIVKKRDPSDIIDGLTAKKPGLVEKDRQQEDAKQALAVKTSEYVGLRADFYSTFSQGCDLIITAYGRGSANAKEATRIRRLLTDRGTGGSTPPPPTPPSA
jgi:hypothetical protein